MKKEFILKWISFLNFQNMEPLFEQRFCWFDNLFAMSYILFVNPQMLSQTGMPAQGVFLATIIGSVVGTLMMAFMPIYLMHKHLGWA